MGRGWIIRLGTRRKSSRLPLAAWAPRLGTTKLATMDDLELRKRLADLEQRLEQTEQNLGEVLGLAGDIVKRHGESEQDAIRTVSKLVEKTDQALLQLNDRVAFLEGRLVPRPVPRPK